ncbi:MAG: phenylacetic acid degradation protein PaaN, partial [Cyclobacteriaceae bacterium]
MSLIEKHREEITKAIEALHQRTFYAAFPEQPAPAIYGETADADGQAKFKSYLGKKFDELKQTGATGWAGQEESPYLQ